MFKCLLIGIIVFHDECHCIILTNPLILTFSLIIHQIILKTIKKMKTVLTLPRKKNISYFLMILMLFQTVGCKYYKVESTPSNEYVSIHNIGEIHKFFIVHAGENLYALKKITADAIKITGNIEKAHDSIYYSEERKYRYKSAERNILNEIHIYLNENIEVIPSGFTEIPLTSIKEIRIIEHDTGKTIASYALMAVGALVIVAAIVALTKSSCPYVYVNDGEAFVFQGETFGGAIAQNLERDDYMPLPAIQTVNGNYKIRISNELKEYQFTNLAELVVVKHQNDQMVLLDKFGNPHVVHKANKPIIATSSNGENLIPVLEDKDSKIYFFNNNDYSKNRVKMTFKKPENILKGKLVIHGKNTLWFDYLFGEFISKFGGYYENWMEKEAKISSEVRLQKILDNDFPLSVYIKKNDEWKLIDYLFTVGPLASRDFVIPVDVSDLYGEEVEIKIETGFMFWELDYVAMDFSEDNDYEVSIVKPSMAIGTGLKDWRSDLLSTDHQYMIQKNVGEVTELIFKTPLSLKNQTQTVFLHTRGYYELIRDFTGVPELMELNKFKEPGYFSDFSRERYLRVLGNDYEIASINTIN